MRVGWIPGEHDLADLLINTIMPVNLRHGMVASILYNKSVLISEKDEN